ncbi:uncharacterized protein LOC135223067 [Macrobrachium nipponense]|uniref:uncharacterized protein LOC135223067 n=1 Tax=Macrobrachium nipponense TaxID=159736 RepID=UPI0030C88970
MPGGHPLLTPLPCQNPLPPRMPRSQPPPHSPSTPRRPTPTSHPISEGPPTPLRLPGASSPLPLPGGPSPYTSSYFTPTLAHPPTHSPTHPPSLPGLFRHLPKVYVITGQRDAQLPKLRRPTSRLAMADGDGVCRLHKAWWITR